MIINGSRTAIRGFINETTAMLSKRFWAIFNEKANNIPIRSLCPRLWSLTDPNIKDVAKKTKNIVMIGWNIFLQYSSFKLFFRYSDTSSFIAWPSSLREKYLGESILRISLSSGPSLQIILSLKLLDWVWRLFIWEPTKIHSSTCLTAVLELITFTILVFWSIS